MSTIHFLEKIMRKHLILNVEIIYCVVNCILGFKLHSMGMTMTHISPNSPKISYKSLWFLQLYQPAVEKICPSDNISVNFIIQAPKSSAAHGPNLESLHVFTKHLKAKCYAFYFKCSAYFYTSCNITD